MLHCLSCAGLSIPEMLRRIVLVASSAELSQYSVQGVSEQNGRLQADWFHRGTKATLGGGPTLDLSGLRLMTSTGEIVRVADYDQLSAGGNSGNGNNGNGIDTIGEALK